MVELRSNNRASAGACLVLLAFMFALPSFATARVSWFPDDVQDSLPVNVGTEVEETSDITLEGKGKGENTNGESSKETKSPDESDDSSTIETTEGTFEDNVDSEDAIYDEDIPVPEKTEGIEGPRPPVGVDFEPPDWLKAFSDWLDGLEFPDWTEEALRTLFWILVGIAIVFALAGIIRALLRSQRSGPSDASDPNAFLNQLAERTKNQSADAHADQQDYTLAIHALLLDALRELSPHHPIIRAPSATGREIALKIEAGQDGPLYHLVLASEACVFAQSTVSETLFLNAKEWHAEVLRRIT